MGAGEDEHERRRRLIITLAAAAAVARAARAITVCRQHGASLLALVGTGCVVRAMENMVLELSQ